MTVRDATFRLLRELGLTTIFGNPGSTEETFLEDFPDDFRYVLGLHEASVIAAADGYAQITRRPALVNVHTSAGVSNAMGTLISSFQNKTPLIVTAGQQTREMLSLEPWLVNPDPEGLPRPWVKWAHQPARAVDVPAAFMRAYAIAMQPPQGPVFLSIPLDDWDAEVAEPAAVRSVAGRVGPDPERLAGFAEQVAAAERPALVFGADIARGDGWEAAVALAEKVGAPVWAAPSSERPPFPEDHRLYAGGLPFAQGLLAERLEGHDLILVVGAPVFRYYPWVPGRYVPEGATLLHITDDPAESGRAPVGHSLLSDAVLALRALTDLLPVGRAQATVTVQEHRLAPHPSAEPRPNDPVGDDRLTARQLFRLLRSELPADTVVVQESPSNIADLHAEWEFTTPDSYFAMASGALGWDLPAAVGIALAERDQGSDRPVIAIIGDGSLQFSSQALYTAVQQKLPLIVIVPNNGEYGILKAFADFQNNPGVPGLDLPGLKPHLLAQGYGATGLVAATAARLRDELGRARTRPGPTLIEVPIDPTVPPLV